MTAQNLIDRTHDQVACSANLTRAASLHYEMAHSSRQATSIARKGGLRIQFSELLAALPSLSSTRPHGQERTIAFVESQAINGSASRSASRSPPIVRRSGLDYTNNGSAGAITTSGFTKVSGDAFTTTNGNKFRCYITVGNAGSHLNVVAMQ